MLEDYTEIWESDLNESAKLRKELKIALRQKPNYYLYVQFKNYPGNFEREFIAYVFGMLPNIDDDRVNKYIENFEASLSKNDLKEYFEVIDDYLQRTWQDVDDWYENTWYNICSHFENKLYDCNSIRIQFAKPLSNELENLIINRIKSFNYSKPVLITFIDKNKNIIKNYNLEEKTFDEER